MQRKMKCKLVLVNGNIISCDENDTIAEAFVVKNGLIIAVGSNDAVGNLLGGDAKVVDLKGRTVTPGLIDTHNHSAEAGLGDLYSLNLSYPAVKSIQEVVRLISVKVSHVDKGRWINGSGWDEALFEERRQINRWDLDPVSPHNPVVLMHKSGHYLATNTMGLEISGITKETIASAGSTIVKENDVPNGVLLEEGAMNLLLRHVPSWTASQIEASIRTMNDKWAREGVTAIKDCGVYGDCEPYLEAYENVDRRSELKIRTLFAYAVSNVETLRKIAGRLRNPGSERLRLGTVKIFVDGSGMARTAWMYEDWNRDFFNVDLGNKGYPVIDIAELERIVESANDEELQVSIHAIGDRAIDTALAAIRKALLKKPGDRRHSLVHAILPKQEAIREMGRLGVVVETQSPFLYFLGDNYAGNLGPERTKRAIPLKTLIRNGVTTGNGSDTSVAPLAPRLGIWSACVRRPLKGIYGENPFGTDETVTVREALRSYTIEASKCLRWEDKIGSIEVGKYADFVVWSGDMYSMPIEDLKDLRVLMTVIGGEILYQAEDW